jgi:hypothetical protein
MKYAFFTIGIFFIVPLASFVFWFIIGMIYFKIEEIKELWQYHKATQKERLKNKKK